MAKIESPVPGFKGTVVGVTFDDGVAETADAAALSYFRRHRYIINGVTPGGGPPSQVDSRDVRTTTVGTKLRDAAVDPQPGDFLAPTNAGKADPHGPDVVAPGIHGAPPGGPRPGKVHDDPEAQDKAETAHSARVLGVDVTPPDPYATPAPPAESTDAPPSGDGDALTADELVDAKNKADLAAMAEAFGVTLDKKATKADLAEAIVAARDTLPETPAESTDSPEGGPVPSAPTAGELEEAHTKPELFDLAAKAGVDVPKKATKAEVAEAIVAART